MFTDKRHTKRGIFSCVLGVSGLAALSYSMVRIYASGGTVGNAQTVTLLLAILYGLVGLALGLRMLLGRESFPLFPMAGTILNTLLLLLSAGLILWGVLG